MIRSLFLASFFFLAVAHAEDQGAQNTEAGPSSSVGSEYLHQVTGGHFELTPGVGIYSSNIEVKNSSNESHITQIPLTIKGEYGFNDMFSLSAQLGAAFGVTDNTCASSAVCKDTVASGLIDPVLSANLRIPIGIMALRFGADLSTSVGKHKIEADGDQNYASGGTLLAPYLGMDFALADMIFGFKFSYDLYKSDREVQDDTGTPSTYKLTDRKELDAAFFYEFNFPRIVTVGAALGYTNSPESKTKSSNGTKTSNNNNADTYNVQVYVPLRFTPRVTLVPALSVGSTDYKSDSNTVKKQTNTSLGVIARFTF